jgi:peroxiredoxin
MELEALNEVLPEITSAGASLAVITPQLEKFSAEMVKKHHLQFDVLSDLNNKVAGQFKLAFSIPEDLKEVYIKFGIDLVRFDGDDSWTLPVPARYIIDQQSRIVYAEMDPDYTVRPEPADTVAALQKVLAVRRSA